MRRAGLFVVACLAAIAVVAPAAHAGRLKLFTTADGNIGCGLFAGGKGAPPNVRCDISKRTWTAPPKPKSCPYDYGNGATLGRKGPGRYGCASDSAVGVGPRLGASVSVTKGRFTCAIVADAVAPASQGVNCVNRRSRHGFSLSPSAITFF